MKQFNALGLKTFSIPLKNPEGVRWGRESRKFRGSRRHKRMVRLQREKIQNGQKEDKRFEGEGGAEVLH